MELLITLLESAGVFGGLVQLLVMVRGIINQACEMFGSITKGAFA